MDEYSLWKQRNSFRLALSDLGGLHGRHLLRPALRRLRLLDGAEVIGREAGDAHVVVALEHQLDVADLEGRGRTEFGQTARGSDDVVNEVVGHLQDELGHITSVMGLWGNDI